MQPCKCVRRWKSASKAELGDAGRCSRLECAGPEARFVGIRWEADPLRVRGTGQSEGRRNQPDRRSCRMTALGVGVWAYRPVGEVAWNDAWRARAICLQLARASDA